MKFYRYISIFILIASIISESSYGQGTATDMEIIVQPVFEGMNIEKDTWYITNNQDSIQISRLRWYMTDLHFTDKNDELLTTSSHHLLDVFDKSTLSFHLSVKDSSLIKSISFKIGVDAALHENGALSGALDPIHGMYWAWQSGFINFKIEGNSPSCNTRKSKFSFHIGGYKEPYTTAQQMVLNLTDPSTSPINIIVEVSKLFDDLDLSQTNTLMIQGQQASDLSLKLTSLFSVDEK